MCVIRVSEVEQPSRCPGQDPTAFLTQLDCVGVAVGCFVMARCLELGQGITQNLTKAKQFYDKACVALL